MALFIGITSGKGGTGKSTLCCGLTNAFSNLGKSVLAVDLDQGLRCIDLMFGLDENIVYDLGDAMSGADLSDCIYSPKDNSNIHILPAPQKSGTITFEGLKNVVESVNNSFDVVIFDFSAGVDKTLYSALPKTTLFITVCNLDPVSVRDASVMSEALPQTIKEPRLIVNRFNIEYIKDGIFSGVDDIIDSSGLRLLGLVPGSIELSTLSVHHKIPKRSNAFKSFERIAKRILGDDVELPNPKKI